MNIRMNPSLSLLTSHARSTGISILRLYALQSLGKGQCSRSFTTTIRAMEKVRVRYPAR